VNAGGARAVLARHGLLARRDLGQNFLVDEALARKLVTLAGVGSGDTVIEIGTGLGILTRALSRSARRVVTFEVDAGLVEAVRAEGGLPGNVEAHHADIRRVDLGDWIRAAAPPVRVVANLPYSIASPLLRTLLGLRDRLSGWSVMLQREVADRLLADPGSEDYTGLGVLHRLTVRVERALDLHPACFFPRPNVHSTFLRITRLEAPLLRDDELEWVEKVVRAAFGHRRKTLANALRHAGIAADAARIAEVLATLDLDPRVRGEALAPESLLRLARALAASG
jgi:16S rRNA (adenine1518-N6/adenine1519-N6)-dimethyltransferase